MSFLYEDTKGYQYNIEELPVPEGVILNEYLPYVSKYNTNNRTRTTRLNADCFRAIDTYAKGIIGQTVPCSIGMDEDHIFIEYYLFDKIYMVIYQNGLFLTGIKLFGSNTIKTLKLDEDSAAVVLFLAIIQIAKNDKEFDVHLNKYCDYLLNNKAGIKIEETIAILVDNIYQRIEILDDIKVDAYKKLTPASIKNNRVCTILFGKFQIFNAEKKKISMEEMKMEFVTSRILSKKEKNMIPKIPEYMIAPDNIQDICHVVKEIKQSNLVQNLFIYGEPGAGKSTMARMIAYIFGLPYTFLSCKPEMETMDLECSIIPNTGGEVERTQLPTYKDFLYDPAMAAFKVTNQYTPEISQEEAWNLIMQGLHKSGSDFVSVPSPIVEAAKYGYVVEIQEPLIIERPGVLAGINALSDDTGAIRLMTGEVIERHPDCIMIFTTNVESAGCGDVNDSVLSRCPIKIYEERPSLETMAAWAEEVTGCRDSDVILAMCQTIEEISNTLNERNIKDGCCGSRELIAWIYQYKVLGDVMKAAEYSVIAAASLNKENHSFIRDLIALRFQT